MTPASRLPDFRSRISDFGFRISRFGFWVCCWLSRGTLAAAEGLTPEEQAKVEDWLAIIGGLVFLMTLTLLGLALAIRYIAKHSTQPCRWCMEFISKKETVCPRCGKSLAQTGEGGASGSS